MQQLKIKLAEGATLPTKANATDSGYDLTATSIRYDEECGFLEYGTGVFLDIPKGYDVKIYARSSISKYDLFLCNGVGVIDESYRQEIKFRFKLMFDYDHAYFDEKEDIICINELDINLKMCPKIYKVGDKIGQMQMFEKLVYDVVQVDDIEANERGGFGSTDFMACPMKQTYKHADITNG